MKIVISLREDYVHYLSEFNLFDNVELIHNDILSEKNKFDMVLTFRNSHNWLKNKKAEKMYNSIFKIMKKGGVLGIVT